MTAPDRKRAHRVEQIGPAHATRLRKTRAPAPPDQRHPILGGEARAIEGAPNFGVPLRRDEAVDRDAAHIVTAAFVAPLLESGDRLRQIDRRHPNAEHVDPRSRAGGAPGPAIEIGPATNIRPAIEIRPAILTDSGTAGHDICSLRIGCIACCVCDNRSR